MTTIKKDKELRTIYLMYEGVGKVNAFEDKLIKRYENLHDLVWDISKNIDLYTEKMEDMKAHQEEWSAWVIKADKLIEKAVRTGKVTKDGNNFNIELNSIYMPSGEVFGKMMQDYYALINKNNEIGQEMNTLQLGINEAFQDEYQLYMDFRTEYTSDEAQLHFEELNFLRFCDDLSDFVACTSNIHENWFNNSIEFKEYVVGTFNPFAQYIGEFSERLQKLHQDAIERSEIINDPKIIRVKNYELPANSEQMTKYATMLDEAGVRGNGIYLDMSWAAIERNDTNAIMDIIRVAQHKTEALRNIIYGIQLKFSDIPLSEPMGSRENIFLSPKILAWFAHLGEIPMIYFFIRDPGSGGHSLFADMILDGSLEVIQKPAEGLTYYGFESPNINIIFNRLFEGSVHFLEFCYGTGVDPRPHVEYAVQNFRTGFQLDEMFPRPTTFHYSEVEVEWKRMYNR